MSKFTKETFWSLLTKESNSTGGGGIVIPIIQRAYTQGGRGNDATIDKKSEAFLKCLLDALISNKPVELDFIYGSAENGTIHPLDGQQRLTTLFLLHWYIAQKEGRLSSDTKESLKKFTYETRFSSRIFCLNLCQFSISPADNRPLREIIEDQSWFVLSWRNDPSVLSMLGMLGKIHDKLNNTQLTALAFWNKLTSPPEEALITFFYTALEDFNLTDELYIKMNARGKELTQFEKFKAALEKRIDEGEWDKGKSASEIFGNKVDNKWTDLFWNFRDKNDQIDRYFLRIFSAILIGRYAGMDAEKAKRLFSNPESISPDDLDKDSYDYLYAMLNLLYSAWETLKSTEINMASFWWGDNKEPKIFDDFFMLFIAHGKDAGRMTWQQLALFHGFCIYLKENHQSEVVNIVDWLRFIRNLLANGTVDDIDPFVSAKKRFEEMAKSSVNIYNYLASLSITSGFANEQMNEEARKAKIYCSSPDVKGCIQRIENSNFCRGNIGFILDCLGVVDSVVDIDSLKNMEEVVFAHLNGPDISNDFRRALLTTNNNLFYEYWHSMAHPSRHPECYELPQYCIIEDLADLREFSKKRDFKGYLKVLLSDLCKKPLNEILKNYVIPENMPEWKCLLISGKVDIDSNRYIIVSGDNSCAWFRERKKSQYLRKIC